jgi:mannosyltransferase
VTIRAVRPSRANRRAPLTARSGPWSRALVDHGPALAVSAAAAAFGGWRLGAKSISHDEAFSIAVARLDLPSLADVLKDRESFNGLYYTLLHFWQLGGSGEAWLRLPSVIFAVLATYFLFLLNRRLFSVGVALLSAGLLAVNSFFVYYAQDARSYSLAVFLVVLATWLFVRAAEQGSILRWLAYGLVGALAMYAHIFCAFVLIAHLLSVPLRRSWPRLRVIAAAYGLTGVLVAPLLILMLQTDPLQRDFIDEVRLGSFRWLFLNLTGGGGVASRGANLLLLAYFAVCFLGTIWTLRAVNRWRQERDTAWAHGLVLSWLCLPILGAYAISLMRAPIFFPRYLIVVLPALVTLAGIGIEGLRLRLLQVVAIIAIVGLALPPLLSYYRADFKEGEDWRGAVAFVAAAARPEDGIVFLSRYGRRPFEYYLQRTPAEAHLHSLYPSEAWGAYVPALADQHGEWSTSSAADRLKGGYERVWVILLWGGFDIPTEDATALEAELARDYRVVASRVFGLREPLVRLYERTRG